MSDPLDHHHVPIFYLSSWCGSDNKLQKFNRVNTKVVTNRVSPKYTAFEPGLYSLTKVSKEKKQFIEKNFMNKEVDDKASLVMKFLINNGSDSLTEKQRSDWSRFLMSLRLRNPELISDLREEATAELKRQLNLAPEEYKELAADDDPETLSEWVEDNDTGLVDNFGMLMLPGLINNPEIHENITAMNWWTVDFRYSTVNLLTSDRPCLFTSGIRSENCVIALPLTPTLSFFACRNNSMKNKLMKQGISSLAKRQNESIVGQAVKYVYSTDKSHFKFIMRQLR